MTLQDIIVDIHALTEDGEVYENKYGILSDTFYAIYSDGVEPEDDAWVLDWSDWAGVYQLLLRRRAQYARTIQALQDQSIPMINVVGRTARREPIQVPS